MCRSFLDVAVQPSLAGRLPHSHPRTGRDRQSREALQSTLPLQTPLGGSTPSSSCTLSLYHHHHGSVKIPVGAKGWGGDRVSRHPSSTGLRFSPMATTPPPSPPPWVNIYFWQIQEAARRKSSLAGEMGFSLFVILQLPGPAPRDEPTITL